jgi:hypothetical protein
MNDESKLWSWYAERQAEPCESCSRIMSEHEIPELEICASQLGILPQQGVKRAPFLSLNELRDSQYQRGRRYPDDDSRAFRKGLD